MRKILYVIYDYLTPDYRTISNLLKKEMGWERRMGNLHHFDCKLHEIPQYIIKLKYNGIGNKTIENSQLIRMGLMSRKEALEYEENNDSKIPAFLNEFLLNMGMSLEEFNNYVLSAPPLDMFRSTARKHYKQIRKKLMNHSF